jgi:pimeloyl-ACP methyl ester carboxylesterase
MTSIVLVHGAWGGSYGFRRVRPLLSAAGHNVFTPSMTGIGERSHLAGPDVTLSVHMQDVRNTIFYEDLDGIVLLGFSYGGMVVTGLLDDIGDKVRHLVYLDALVPSDGQNAIDVIGTGGQALANSADGWELPPIPRELDTPEATAWSDARRVNQPIGTFTEPVSLSKPLEDWDFTRTFIKASADAAEATDSAFWTTARRAQESPAWNYHEIATNHMVPLNRPEELAAIVLDLAAN